MREIAEATGVEAVSLYVLKRTLDFPLPFRSPRRQRPGNEAIMRGKSQKTGVIDGTPGFSAHDDGLLIVV
jgi:hypothetical protein